MQLQKDYTCIETGDFKQQGFYPQVKLMKWSNEANISLRLDESMTKVTRELTNTYERVIFPDKECHLFTFSNSYEFTIILKSKPVKPYLDFTVINKNCTLWHQPELTTKEISEGCIRPDTIVNSIAVYAPLSGNKYRAGKVTHLYRPYAIDLNKNKVWCDLTIEIGGIVRLWIPTAFLNTAIYPIIIDPTFGYTSVPGSTSDIENEMWASKGTMGGTAGTGDSMSAYVYSSATHNLALAMYIDSSGPTNVITNGKTDAADVTGAAQWKTLDFTTSPSLAASTDYWLTIWGEKTTGNFFAYWDTAASSYRDDIVAYAPPTWKEPFQQDTYYPTRRYGVYVTYTESGGGGLGIPLAMNHYKQLKRN